MLTEKIAKVLSILTTNRIAIFILIAVLVAALCAIICLIILKDKPDTSPKVGALPVKINLLQGKILSQAEIFYLTDTLTIGSKRKCDIHLEGNGIEPMHARIINQNSQVYIEDLSTSGGVAIGGMRIQDRNPLRTGDIVSIGDTEFSVEFIF